MREKPVLFSGIQPSGKLHIGNYIGAIKNWVELQKKYDCLFSIVDLHTITIRQDPKLLHERCYEFLALNIACGLDHQKNIMFCQSHVPAHAQLAWVLNCYASMGELNRMTQFKDKSKKHIGNISVGLFDYPVLMTADILLYRANIVPVGADQKQHVELCRDIAIRFNNIYGEIFTVPKPYIRELTAGARIMSLQDPDKKMSSSDINESNIISLLDPPEIVSKKLKRAMTDSGSDILFKEDKPGISNLLTIYSAVTDKSIEQLEKEYQNEGYGKFKGDLAEATVEFLKPIQARYKELRGDETILNAILRDGAEKAKERAQTMIDKVYEAVGFVV